MKKIIYSKISPSELRSHGTPISTYFIDKRFSNTASSAHPYALFVPENADYNGTPISSMFEIGAITSNHYITAKYVAGVGTAITDFTDEIPFLDYVTTVSLNGTEVAEGKSQSITWLTTSRTFLANDVVTIFFDDLIQLAPDLSDCFSYLFREVTVLSEVTIPSLELATIDFTNGFKETFESSSVTKVVIGNFSMPNCLIIETAFSTTFGSCSGLTEVTIGNFYTPSLLDANNLFNQCFSECASLQEFTLPQIDFHNVTNLNSAFCYAFSAGTIESPLTDVTIPAYDFGNVLEPENPFDGMFYAYTGSQSLSDLHVVPCFGRFPSVTWTNLASVHEDAIITCPNDTTVHWTQATPLTSDNVQSITVASEKVLSFDPALPCRVNLEYNDPEFDAEVTFPYVVSGAYNKVLLGSTPWFNDHDLTPCQFTITNPYGGACKEYRSPDGLSYQIFTNDYRLVCAFTWEQVEGAWHRLYLQTGNYSLTIQKPTFNRNFTLSGIPTGYVTENFTVTVVPAEGYSTPDDFFEAEGAVVTKTATNTFLFAPTLREPITITCNDVLPKSTLTYDLSAPNVTLLVEHLPYICSQGTVQLATFQGNRDNIELKLSSTGIYYFLERNSDTSDSIWYGDVLIGFINYVDNRISVTINISGRTISVSEIRARNPHFTISPASGTAFTTANLPDLTFTPESGYTLPYLTLHHSFADNRTYPIAMTGCSTYSSSPTKLDITLHGDPNYFDFEFIDKRTYETAKRHLYRRDQSGTYTRHYQLIRSSSGSSVEYYGLLFKPLSDNAWEVYAYRYSSRFSATDPIYLVNVHPRPFVNCNLDSEYSTIIPTFNGGCRLTELPEATN